MDLQIRHEPTPAPPAPAHTFAALPTPIAQALLQKRPFAALTILRIQPPTPNPPIHLAWTGHTTPHPETLSLPHALATALTLPESTIVKVSIVERLTTPSSPNLARSITFHPTSYISAPHLAVSHFAQLSAAAIALESSILPSIRVVTPNLPVPFTLPAGHTLLLTPVALITELDDPPYAILTPHTRILIQPPPSQVPSHNIPPLDPTYRLLRPPGPPAGISAAVAATHAFLPATSASEPSPTIHILVTDPAAKTPVSYPVAATFHPTVPARHITLPAFLHLLLPLPALSPLVIRQVPPFPAGDVALPVREEPTLSYDALPTFQQLSETSAVYFHALPLQGLRVLLDQRPVPTPQLTEPPWDRDIPDEEDDHPLPPRVTDFRSPLQRGPLARENDLVAAIGEATVLQGFSSFPEQTLSKKQPPAQTNCDDMAHPAALDAQPALRRLETRQQAMLSLTTAGRIAVEKIVRLARTLLRRTRGKKCVAVVVEGVSGSGKTHVLGAVTAVLRELGRVRVVCVRGKLHAAERAVITVGRVRRTFQAAVDGGPGCVVLDDVDFLLGTRGGGEEGRARGEVLAEEIGEQLRAEWSTPLLVLMTCQTARDLQTGLRSPGVLSSVLTMKLPSAEERALMYWMALQELGYEAGDGEELDEIRAEVCELGKLSEGYTPRDIHVSLKRARLTIDLNNDEDALDLRRVVRVLTKVVGEMTPSARSGIRFSEPSEREALSWAAIGGLARAKSALWEALELPSMRPDLFSKVPIRLPRGILLFGPPGCGKTMLARTAAAESGMRCVMVKGPELLSKYIGESEAQVRRAFEKAASSTPCVLLFDEFDSLAPRRGGESTGVADRVVNTLLTCMDGAERLSEGVYVLATTSRPELIDPALLRPGRLDRWIPVDVPKDRRERLEILKCLCAKLFPLTQEVETTLEDLADTGEGYTGADLGAIINDAHLKYGKQQKYAEESSDSLSIPELLVNALRQTRPSLSRSQRAYFQAIMARFAPDQDRGTDEAANGKLPHATELFGKRVALQ